MSITAVHTLQAIGIAVWFAAWMFNFDWYHRLYHAEEERRP